MRVARFEKRSFGIGDTLPSHRIAVPSTFGNARLAAIEVTSRSQIDMFRVCPNAAGNANAVEVPLGVVGVRQAFLVDPQLTNPNVFLAPVIMYPDTALTNQPICLLRSSTMGMDRYLEKGGYAEVVAYYGGIPNAAPIRRDPLAVQAQIRVTDVLLTCLRIAAPGRDKAAISMLNDASSIVTYNLYGCTESMDRSNGFANERHRDLLATGGGVFSLNNLDSFDSYELDAIGPGAVTTDYNVRFTAWDS